MEVQAMSSNGITERMERILSTAPMAPVADSWERKVEAGLRAAHAVEQERDQAAKALGDCRTELRGLQAEHDALRMAHARLQTEVEAYRHDRDVAVERRAKADGLLDAVLTLLQKHRGQPLQEELAALAEGKS
jgi:septal ring factor EnvC (AmiA/AmiB activator)